MGLEIIRRVYLMTRYRDAITRVLAAYASGPGLVQALDTLIKTAEDNARTLARDEVAQSVCEGLHDGPASGLKCRGCYEAEQIVGMEAQVNAEIAIARRQEMDEDVVDATLVE